jgi:hypothetical protein
VIARESDDRHPIWPDRRRWLWLLFGVSLLALTQVRASVAVLAWIAPVPWLRYLRITGGWRSRLSFCVALFAGWTLATAKIASEPTLVALAPVFALPIAAGQAAAYLTWAPRVLSRSSWLLGSGLSTR